MPIWRSWIAARWKPPAVDTSQPLNLGRQAVAIAIGMGLIELCYSLIFSDHRHLDVVIAIGLCWAVLGLIWLLSRFDP